jgi:ribosomal protein S27AE
MEGWMSAVETRCPGCGDGWLIDSAAMPEVVQCGRCALTYATGHGLVASVSGYAPPMVAAAPQVIVNVPITVVTDRAEPDRQVHGSGSGLTPREVLVLLGILAAFGFAILVSIFVAINHSDGMAAADIEASAMRYSNAALKRRNFGRLSSDTRIMFEPRYNNLLQIKGHSRDAAGTIKRVSLWFRIVVFQDAPQDWELMGIMAGGQVLYVSENFPELLLRE